MQSFVGIVLYVSYPIKERLYRNYILVSHMVIQVVWDFIMCLTHKVAYKDLGLVDLPSGFNVGLFFILLGFFAFDIIYVEFIVRRFCGDRKLQQARRTTNLT